MASPRKRLQGLVKQIPDERRISGFVQILETRHVHSDYPVAILGAAMVERALEVSIMSRFVPINNDKRNKLFNFEQKGPIADLAARIRVGAALGLYGPLTEDDLENIRTVRNAFAHSTNMYMFSTKEIAEVCARFHIIAEKMIIGASKSTGRGPKANYITACTMITRRLRTRLESATAEAEQIKWPRDDGRLP